MNDWLPDEAKLFENIFSLMGRDVQKTDWFYDNKTIADYTLLIAVNNKLVDQEREGLKQH